jgi:hypothetical protein
MLIKSKCFLVFYIAILALSSFNVFAQERQVKLKDKRITINMTQKPLFTVFTRLIEKYDIAIGFEESILDRDHRHYEFQTNVAIDKYKVEYQSDKEFSPPVPEFSQHLLTVNFKDAKLESVMDSIVRQMENYDWEISNEVINIFPIRGRDSRLKKLLDVRVRSFGVGIGAEVGSIQAQLMLFLPEFKIFLKENNLDFNAARNGSAFNDRIIPDGMGFNDLSFKELLNVITKSKRGGWILQIKTQKDNPDKEFVEILI